jgi:hypothetical protein
MAVHHIPPENQSTFIARYVAFEFFVSITPTFNTVHKNFLEMELEALNDKEIFPLFLLITLATFVGSIVTPTAWCTTGTQLVHNRYATGTQLVHNWYTTGTQLVHNWYR